MNHNCLENIQTCLISVQILLMSWMTSHWKIGKMTNEESTSELGICIVLGLFRGMVGGMDGGIICVSTWKYASKSEYKGSHISISIDSWEYIGNESSVWKEEIMRCSKSSRRIWVLIPRTKEDMLKHMRSSKVSGMTQRRLDVAKKTSWKSLGCAPLRRETCTRCASLAYGS